MPKEGLQTMGKAYEFLKECGTFFLLTIHGKYPAGRPFGGVMEEEGILYVSTSDQKEVYRQLKENSRVQLLAMRKDCHWARITGLALECEDPTIRQAMFRQDFPALAKSGKEDPHYRVFGIQVEREEYK